MANGQVRDLGRGPGRRISIWWYEPDEESATLRPFPGADQ
jgi:hypothetical protein